MGEPGCGRQFRTGIRPITVSPTSEVFLGFANILGCIIDNFQSLGRSRRTMVCSGGQEDGRSHDPHELHKVAAMKLLDAGPGAPCLSNG